jgi:NAD(P)-dependent dehydrogenase (short-subunit alcohol dehydrogenase family)
MRLAGRHALITGAGRGIGLATAKAFAREGAAVAIADVELARATEAAAAIAAAGGRALAVQADVADPESVGAMVRTVVAAFGRIDVLCNNAGIAGKTPFLDTTLEEWERILRVNLTGAFLVAQAVARTMAENGGGKIINIASVSGQRGGEGRAAYGAAKAGLDLLTKVMAVELAPLGINVNAIAPGPIETEMARGAHDPASRAAYMALVPVARYGTPEEVADAAVFLASDESRYIHGHTLNVDGGFRAAGLMSSRYG